jgi:hypothetical protein
VAVNEICIPPAATVKVYILSSSGIANETLIDTVSDALKNI